MKRNFFSLLFLSADEFDVAHYAHLHRENLDGTEHELIENGIDLKSPISSSLPEMIIDLVKTSPEPVRVAITNSDKRRYLNHDRDNSEDRVCLTFRKSWPEETAVNLATIQRNFGDVRTGRRCVSIVVEWITD